MCRYVTGVKKKMTISDLIVIRLSSDEKFQIMKAAASLSLSMSAYCRMNILIAAQKLNLETSSV